MANLVPTELFRQYQQASTGGARDIMSSAMQMAGNYLQGLKTMAGGQTGVPMKTMARQESDANIASTQQAMENAKRTLALNELQKYSDLAGKTPDLATINELGLGGTFSSIADQNTAEADLNRQKLAVDWANALKSSKSGGSGGSGGSTGGGSGTGPLDDTNNPEKTEGERKRAATAKAIKLAVAKYDKNLKEGSADVKRHPLYYTINSILKDPGYISTYAEQGVDTKQVIDGLIRSKAKVSSDEYFKNNSDLGSIYYSMFPVVK